jgi:hypothetical protein
MWISDESYESAGIFDVDGNGILDIVSGAYWYEGPDFRKKHFMGEVKRYGEYYDDFSTIPIDVNGDGRMDVITGGWWGGSLRWRENPGDPTKEWSDHIIAKTLSIETTRAWDVDGDGEVEIVPNSPPDPEVAVFKLRTDARGRGGSAFDRHVVYRFPKGAPQGHGLGCGDVAGNGRMDIVLENGWLEAPADPFKADWKWHPEFSFGMASVPMLVQDINGDGKSEIIVGKAHGYGLDWWERMPLGAAGRDPGGPAPWVRHPIDPWNAQFHDLQWVDIDGDGSCELVTGKRHRAHNGTEAGEWDDLGIYYYKWNGESFSKQIVCYGPFGTGKGCGISFAVADLRGTGRLDLVAPGKDGLYLFWNEGQD